MIVNFTFYNWQEAAQFRPDILRQTLSTVNSGRPSALFPFENLRNKYYGLRQSTLIGRLQPPVGLSAHFTFQAGGGPSYKLSDEAQRQLALGMHLANADLSFYRLAKQ